MAKISIIEQFLFIYEQMWLKNFIPKKSFEKRRIRPDKVFPLKKTFGLVERHNSSASLYAHTIKAEPICLLVKQQVDRVQIDGRSGDQQLIYAVVDELRDVRGKIVHIKNLCLCCFARLGFKYVRILVYLFKRFLPFLSRYCVVCFFFGSLLLVGLSGCVPVSCFHHIKTTKLEVDFFPFFFLPSPIIPVLRAEKLHNYDTFKNR
ncbi:unnamed protein product [Toxocara canis]|uniref:AP-3 complex subunit delta Mu C-terminal domain-containing protein n=1 Tax=Toxocara canis TaxID=6265 RepID=A0A183UDX9_TOXCA|nr:unnamed protein product [Toxocara canis]